MINENNTLSYTGNTAGGLDEAMESLHSAIASLNPVGGGGVQGEEDEKYTVMSPVVRSSAGSNCNGLELVHFRSDTVKFEE